ncbi:hypothetical protein GT034_36900 [Streptomyces sp. SID2563]|nr:hypothetical protein [Streptomyces sp. SID2563]
MLDHGQAGAARGHHGRLRVQRRTHDGVGHRTGGGGRVALPLHHRQFGPGRDSGGVRLTPDHRPRGTARGRR